MKDLIKLSIGALGRPSLPPIPSLRTNYALKWGKDPPNPPLYSRGPILSREWGEDPPKPPSLLKEANFVPRMGGGSPQTPL